MKWKLIDFVGREALTTECEVLGELHCGLMSCLRKKGEKVGYIDRSDKQIIPARYDYAFGFDPTIGWASVIEKRDKKFYHGFIDTVGREVIPLRYERLDHPREGLAVFRLHGEKDFGFLGLDGKVVIPPKFNWASGFACGLALVSFPEEEGYSLIDHGGKRVMGSLHYAGGRDSDGWPDPTEVESLYGVLLLCDPKTHKNSVIDRLGRTMIEEPAGGLKFSEISGNLIQIYDEPKKKVGLMDFFGNLVVEPKYDTIRSFVDGYLEIHRRELRGIDEQDEKYGLIDTNGREVVPIGKWSFKYVGCNRIGFVEKTATGDFCGYLALPGGKVVIAAKYKRVGAFSEGFACVSTDQG